LASSASSASSASFAGRSRGAAPNLLDWTARPTWGPRRALCIPPSTPCVSHYVVFLLSAGCSLHDVAVIGHMLLECVEKGLHLCSRKATCRRESGKSEMWEMIKTDLSAWLAVPHAICKACSAPRRPDWPSIRRERRDATVFVRLHLLASAHFLSRSTEMACDLQKRSPPNRFPSSNLFLARC